MGGFILAIEIMMFLAGLGALFTGRYPSFLLAALTYDPFSEYERKKRKGKLRSRRPGDPFDDEEAAARWRDDEDDEAPRKKKKKRSK